MILKLIVIAAVALALYRLAGGTLLPKRRNEETSADESPEETLVECNRCSTYVVKKEAIFFKGKYYCSRECLPR